MRDRVFGLGPLETVIICGTSIEAIGDWEAVLAEVYKGVIQKEDLAGPDAGCEHRAGRRRGGGHS